MKIPAALLCFALAVPALASAADAVPRHARAGADRALRTVTTDPPRDALHPARNRQLTIDSHGSRMNALFFLAAGAGPHPTMLLLHGLPGNERNLDLAQAVRRAGWNVLTFTYRGAWGSEGDFAIANVFDDTRAAMRFLRSQEASSAYGIDENRLVIAGHSMGGFAAASFAAAREYPDEDGFYPNGIGPIHRPLAGLILLDAWNIGADAARARAAGAAGRAALVASLDDFGHALHGATPESIADEIIAAQGPDWSLPAMAPHLRVPVLTITATHGGAAENRVMAEAMRRAGVALTAREIDSDHPFADHRIEMEAEVVRWLQGIEGR